METIILFIIIAAVSTFFGKAKENPGNPKRRTLPELKKEFQEVYKEISQTEIPKSLKELNPNRPKRIPVPQPISVEPKEIAAKVPVKTSPVIESTVRIKAEEEEGRVISVTEKNLVDAVVWAEILGPPRSKRPHYRR